MNNARAVGWLVFLTALLTAGVLVVHRLETGGDNLDFILLAKSIQQGQWIDALAWPRPAGYSACLAALLRLAGVQLSGSLFYVNPFSIILIKVLNILSFASSAVAVYLWSRRVARSALVILGTALLFSVNQTIASRSSVISAEPLFLLLTFSALAWWEKGRSEEGVPGIILAGFAAAAVFAMFVKFQGLVMVPAFGLWILLHKRWSLRNLAVLFVVGLAASLSLGMQWFGNRFCLTHVVASDPYGYGESVSWVTRLAGAVHVYTSGWADLVFPKTLGDRGAFDLLGAGWLGGAFVIVVLGLMVTGFIRSCRRDITLGHLYFFCFSGLLAVWPDYLSRYLIPIVPLGIWFVLEGMEGAGIWILRAFRGDTKNADRITLCFVIVTLAWALSVNLFAGVKNWRNIITLRDQPPWAPERYVISREDDFADYMVAGQWLGENAPSNAVIFCRKALFIELAARRRCEYYSVSATPEELWKKIEETARANPVLILKDTFSADSTYGKVRELKLMPAIRRHENRLELLHRTAGGSEVLRVIPPR